MTEKEKMLAGKAYVSFGEELLEERQAAKELLFDFNNLRPSELEAREEILRKLFGRVGRDFFIEPPFRCDYGYNITVGDSFYCNYNCVILDCCPVEIGDNVLFGPNVSLFAAGHPLHYAPRIAGLEYGAPIRIGNNVWLGGGVIVNGGVSIGDNTVVASGSVVTKDIPANVLAAGNPCRVLRPITEEDRPYYFKRLKIEEQEG
ncbi:sugar O-acetyltransferase [Anaeromassilibacillus senegalensis]|uniref:sugar O-acetyltransferase n=1 Tax=Anaeromassilibacillus senegalensis TaxID=1673717 RepID=UPI0006812101|nr:sugar O-acetyltransferase [Anaeromassilibacillus senegalensis]